MSTNVYDVLSELEELYNDIADLIDDLEKIEDFAKRIEDLRDAANGGNTPDPQELGDLLSDMLECIAGKIPLGPYKWLIKIILKIIREALANAIALTLTNNWLHYKQRREGLEQSHEEACEEMGLDPLACEYMRLRWLEEQAGDDEEGEEDEEEPEEDEEEDDEISSPVIHIPATRWKQEHDDCCSNPDGRGNQKPEIRIISGPTWGPAPTPTSTIRKVEVEFEATHPCGVHWSVWAYTRGRSPSGGMGPWIRLQKRTSNFRLRVRKGKRLAEVISSSEVGFVVRATSNCETSKTEKFTFSQP